jgi:hypothetical protein
MLGQLAFAVIFLSYQGKLKTNLTLPKSLRILGMNRFEFISNFMEF